MDFYEFETWLNSLLDRIQHAKTQALVSKLHGRSHTANHSFAAKMKMEAKRKRALRRAAEPDDPTWEALVERKTSYDDDVEVWVPFDSRLQRALEDRFQEGKAEVTIKLEGRDDHYYVRLKGGQPFIMDILTAHRCIIRRIEPLASSSDEDEDEDAGGPAPPSTPAKGLLKPAPGTPVATVTGLNTALVPKTPASLHEMMHHNDVPETPPKCQVLHDLFFGTRHLWDSHKGPHEEAK